MVRYYILIKKKGAKGWRSAVQSRKGVSLARLKLMVRKNIKRGFIGRIVTESQLKRFMKSHALKGMKRRKVIKRRKQRSRKRRGRR